jgi:hypothetical protein
MERSRSTEPIADADADERPRPAIVPRVHMIGGSARRPTKAAGSGTPKNNRAVTVPLEEVGDDRPAANTRPHRPPFGSHKATTNTSPSRILRLSRTRTAFLDTQSNSTAMFGPGPDSQARTSALAPCRRACHWSAHRSGRDLAAGGESITVSVSCVEDEEDKSVEVGLMGRRGRRDGTYHPNCAPLTGRTRKLGPIGKTDLRAGRANEPRAAGVVLIFHFHEFDGYRTLFVAGSSTCCSLDWAAAIEWMGTRTNRRALSPRPTARELPCP